MALFEKLSAALLAAALLSGCATIRGSQDSVPELAPRSLVPIEQALRAYHEGADSRGGMEPAAYRNFILSSYVAAIDHRYNRFTDQLRSGDRGSALGIDLLLLGLTGATALAGESDIQELATVTAVATGAGAIIDEQLFFDRTMPAIIAAMDAERAVIKADIARKRALSAERYSLDEAIDDLQRLQEAGRIDRAIARITRAAETDRAAQQARLDAVTSACPDITAVSPPLSRRFRMLVGTQDGEHADVRRAAAAGLGIDTADDAVPTWTELREAFSVQLCDEAERERFVADLEQRFPN